MATEYVELAPGGGGAQVAVDSDGTGVWQYIKVAFGGDGTQTIVTSSAGLPVAQQGTWTVDLGATDNAVLDAIAASVAAIDTDATTIIGHVDGIETLIGTTNTNTGAATTALQIIDDWDESDRAKVNLIVGQAGIAAGAGNVAATVPRMTLAADDPAVALLTTIDADTSAMATSLAIIDGMVFGGGTEAAAQRVTIANDSTGVLSVDDNGSSLTVDYATTGSGTATGALRVELPTNGTGVIATVGAVTAITNALPAGTNNIGDMDVLSVVPGTGATNQGKAVDSAAGATDTGIAALVVRDDALASLTPADGDYTHLRVNSTGALWVDRSGTQPVSYATTGSGTATGALRVELPTNGTGVLATVSALTGGGVAHDGADSGNPLKTGARAISSNVTAQTANDRSDSLSDLLGYHLVRPYALNQNVWSDSAGPITGTSSTEVRAAPGASVRLHVTSLLVTNADATVGTNVQITDGSGGTVLWEGYAAAVGGGFSCQFPTPLRLTANTALHAICGTTSSETVVSAAGFTEIS